MLRTPRARVGQAALVLAAVGCLYRYTAGLEAVDHSAMRSRAAQARTASAGAPLPVSSAQRELLDQYCVTCHNERLRTAELMLDKMDVGQIGAGAPVWEKVVRKLRSGTMPPPGRPRPDQAATLAFASWLETQLDRAAAANLNPGRPPALHRLNRTEYGNAIYDVLGLEIDGRSLLPPDDEDHGFDNIAEALSLSPTLLERYLVAARQISQLAVGDPSIRSFITTYAVPDSLTQDDHLSDDLPFGSRGGAAVQHHFPLDGEYVIRVRLRRTLYQYIRGLGKPHRLDVRVDGVRVGLLPVGGEYQDRRRPPMTFGGDIVGDSAWEAYSHAADKNLDVRVSVKAGTRAVAAAFDRTVALPEGILDVPVDKSSANYAVDEMQDGNPAVASVAIEGPLNAGDAEDTPSRRKIFSCRPSSDSADAQKKCATKILSTLARRAYRRPVGAEDIQALLSFYEAGRQTDGQRGFEAGIQAALVRMLTDPEFLFRIEYDPPQTAAGTSYRLSDIELASRLSFFLWSSIPDDELLDVAAREKLKERPVLRQQVRRMLGHERSTALVRNFASQWLSLGDLRNVAPIDAIFPEFDENLREAMQQETELFLESQLREDRSVVDLLRANYTFLNERLARHYGVPGVHGAHFRRVTFRDDDRRGGILGHGSILTVTSYPNRTSPVLRGVWLLENILGAPPPPPPPNVPSLQERSAGGKPPSVRARLEQHRQNPVCASCHRVIDPMGFALEEFDAIGRSRAVNEDGSRVDAAGVLVDGTQFVGLTGLRQVLMGRQEDFVTVVVEKLLTYALGRSLEYYDMPVVRQIVRDAEASEYRWSALIMGIANSAPFQMRRSQ